MVMNNYALQLNLYLINKIGLKGIQLKKVFSCQKRVKSKVASLPAAEDNIQDSRYNKLDKECLPLKICNDENSLIGSNKLVKKDGHSANLNYNKLLSSDKHNQLGNILSNNKTSKDFFLHYRPSSFIVPISNYKDDFNFLQNHNNYPVIDTQLNDYFRGKNNEIIWQEIKIDLKNFYRPYLRLSKIRLTGLVVLTSMAGFVIAPGEFVFSQFLFLSTGVLLTSSAANTINQFFEVPFDSQMNRTKSRPLICGNVSTQSAIYFAMASSGLGSLILYFGVNPLTCALGVANLFLYTLVYTPLKRVSVSNTWVGSIVGAIPPIMGWTAVTGSVDAGGLLLGGLLFAWQFPHFCALSWNLKAEYAKAGYQMMSAIAPNLCRKSALRYSTLMIPLCMLFTNVGITSWHFIYLSALPNSYMAWLAWRFYRDADASSSRKLFRFSLIYLPVVFALIFATKNNWGAVVEVVQ